MGPRSCPPSAGLAKRRSVAIAGFLVAVVAAGCGSDAPTPGGAAAGSSVSSPAVESIATPPAGVASSSAVTASAGPRSTSAAGSAATTPGSSAQSSSPAPTGLDDGPRASIDSTLLDVLPLAVAGLDVAELAAAEQEAVGDPDLGRNVARIVTAFVGDPAGANWAYAAVVAPRAGAATDEFLGDWRQSFDASACARAGGIGDHSTTNVGGRDVYATSCASGVTTYHVWLRLRGLLISISSFGAAQLGKQVLEGLRL